MGLTQRLASALGFRSEVRQPATDAEAVVAALMPQQSKRAPERGVAGMLNAYNNSPWVRAIASRIAQAVGRATWQVYAIRRESSERYFRHHELQQTGIKRRDFKRRAIDVPEGTELVEIGDHPALALLAGGSYGMPGNLGRQTTQLYIELAGEAFWMLEPQTVGSRLVPINFYIIPPTWVTDVPQSEDGVFTLESSGNTIRVPQEMMIWFRNPSMADLYGRGVGHLRAFGDEIDTDEYTAKYIRSFFYNQARPDLLVFGPNLSSADIQRLEYGWLQQARGFLKAHRPFFLNREVKVKELTYKFSEMQLIELRKWERDLLVNGRGVPPEVLGIIENSNRATIDAADYLFGKGVVDPALDIIRGFLQSELMPLYDDRLILGYDSPVQEDKDYQLEALKAAPWTATVNEWRAVQGLDAVEYGDVHVLPLNQKPVDMESGETTEEERMTELTAYAKGLKEGFETAAAADGDTCCSKTAAIAPRSAPDRSEQPTPDGTSREPGEVVEAILDGRTKQVGGTGAIDLAETLGAQMMDDLIAAFNDVRNQIDMSAFVAALERGNLEGAIAILEGLDVPVSLEDASATLREALYVVGAAAADELAAALGADFTFEMISEAALAELEQVGAAMVTNVSDETIAAIRAALVDSYSTGKTATEVAKEIRGLVGLTQRDAELAVKKRALLIDGGMSATEADAVMDKWIAKKIRKRAETIALNELAKAGNRGQEITWEAAQELGLISQGTARRIWLTTPDDRLCNLCAPMTGQTAKVGEPFETSVGPVYTPQDIHVRCRCGEGLVFVK